MIGPALGLAAAILLAATPGGAAETGFERIVAAKELRLGIAVNAPWVVKSVAGELSGYDIDLVRALAADLGVTPRFIEMPFADLVPRLARGDVDMVASGLALTPARARQVAFSDVTGPAAIASSRHAPRSAAIRPRLCRPKASRSRRWPGRRTRTTAGRFSRAQVIELSSAAETLAALLDGRAQSLAATAPVPRLTATLYDAKLQLLRRPLTHAPEAFGLRVDDVRLLTVVNNWIAARKADGTIDRANDYWFGRMTWLRTLEPVETRPSASSAANGIPSR